MVKHVNVHLFKQSLPMSSAASEAEIVFNTSMDNMCVSW